MTKEAEKQRVREILTNYLEINQNRKTPERYAILDAVYDTELEARNFRVSRATLYNTMRLFIELRLVIRHRFIGRTMYEACFNNEEHIHQVCTVCGNVTEVVSPGIHKSIEETKLFRFRRDGYTLYIYGVCSTCQARITRQKKNNKK